MGPKRRVRGQDATRASVQKQLAAALALAKNGRRGAALNRLGHLRERYPSDCRIWLESALILDRMDRETEAIPFYRRAIKLGLRGRDLRDALVCLASSLRSAGEAQKAVPCLRKAIGLFPRDPVVKLFLALCYFDLREYAKALRAAGLACLIGSGQSDLDGYGQVLERKFNSLGGR